MPTTVPARTAAPIVRRLSWSETARFFVLIARVRWLNVRLHFAHRRADRLGPDRAGDGLLRLAYCWLATHEEIAALLGIAPPAQVRKVQAALRRPER